MNPATLDAQGIPHSRVSPGAADALYATGHWLYSQSYNEQALDVFRTMVCLAPQDERGWLGLGAVHEAQGQADVALDVYGAASTTIGNAPRCDIARARLLRARGMNAQADDALAQAARIAYEQGDEALRALLASEGPS